MNTSQQYPPNYPASKAHDPSLPPHLRAAPQVAPHGWVLTDERTGHNAQSLGLAHAIGKPFEQKILSYNLWAGLPNFLLADSITHLDWMSRQHIRPPWPAFVIASGRRLVPVMLFIKAHSPHTRLIQNMWPGFLNPFDYIVVPQHDNRYGDKRLVQTLGALHTLTGPMLELAGKTLPTVYQTLPQPRIAVLIGGELTPADMNRLADLSELLAGTGGSLMMTTSRRTPRQMAIQLKQRLTCASHLYQWGSAERNPYPGLLHHADFIVVTADSISMASEACYTGKPVFIFEPAKPVSRKHQQFVQSLYSGGYAAPLTPESSRDWHPANRLDETKKVAQHIAQYLK